MNARLGSIEQLPGIGKVGILRLVLLAGAILFSWLGLWKGYVPFDVVAVLATLIGGIPIFRETIESIRNRTLNMEASMSIGAIASLAVGEFIPAAVIIFFALFAEELESLTMSRGRQAIGNLIAKTPKMAIVRREGVEVSVPAESVRVEEIVIVKSGEKIPVDETVLNGSAFVDEAPITGESLPVEKLSGDRVFAGSINDSGFLEVEATHVGRDTTFSRIISIVEAAERTKAPIERIGDRLAANLIYVALILAAFTFVMLTGDNEGTAKAVARELGIDEVQAHVLPEQKSEKIRELLASGRKVAMVGDGINDAPALAEATVGIAMVSGTDVALETADIALMTNELSRIPQLIALGRENRRVIMQNFTGTLVVDGFGVALAIAGMIHPLAAAFIHTFSELAFMLNSARLLRS